MTRRTRYSRQTLATLAAAALLLAGCGGNAAGTGAGVAGWLRIVSNFEIDTLVSDE